MGRFILPVAGAHGRIVVNRKEPVSDDEQQKYMGRILADTNLRADETNADEYHHPYEPTPYSVLERLTSSGLINKDDVVLDYGCGKGRVGFFLSYRIKARTVGIEYDERIYESALENQKTAKAKANFVLTRAEEYEVPPEVNRCYFFIYYPADEYISYLMTVDELEFYDEIECDDLFVGNDPRERIMIFQLPDYGIEE